ncbi:hypothetical protein IFM89_037409 [Coptis chinensis]|uniref:Protein argonaute N-terminal domain-containing protein n=1 Tax=Coptis chinensis TaxID=261450 RepID=A0A835I967_9MAGN|nr:hypothetical protein IFM89_037409 [Coptis chinensis]
MAGDVPLRVDELDTKIVKVQKSRRVQVARPGFARTGQPIQLLTNHFKVNIGGVDGDFYHYSQIALFYEDDHPIDAKGIGRKVIDKLHETYDTELGGKHFATAGNGSPGGSRSPNGSDRKRFRRPNQSKSFKVQISYAVKIPMKSIASALRDQESENS